ncbi:hypothetical protein TNCT_84481 [Trichonephila clavata]|uniref:Uncharacterized protein n=1 Tax=Trichonephila clavata TaxID=2740835 RepID=A0A8X6GMX9_TRICU|nr:hypothetical protein TNCT_564311 [Trichonephila clavata]GFR07592.1 hypothetical protein TNCT_84481 [Trichonephila clavata]
MVKISIIRQFRFTSLPPQHLDRIAVKIIISAAEITQQISWQTEFSPKKRNVPLILETPEEPLRSPFQTRSPLRSDDEKTY